MSNRSFQETPVVAFPNLGGMDSTSAPSQVPLNSLTNLENAVFGERKTWKKRGGLEPKTTSALVASTTVKKLVDYWIAGGSGTPSQKIVATCGTKVFSSSDGISFTDVSGTRSIPADSIVSHAVVGDKLVLAFNATTPIVYTGTGNVASLGGTPPSGNVVAEHLNRCWMNDRTDPHRVYFTGVTGSGGGDPTLWSIANGGGSFYVDEDDGDPSGITAMWRHNDALYVSKLTKIYRIEGRNSNTFRPALVVDGIGAVSQNMVVPVGNDVFFASLLGFHSLGTVAQSGSLARETYISRDMHKTIHSKLNRARFKHGHGAFIESINSVIWAVPLTGASNNTVALVYSLTNNRWSIFTNFKCDALMKKYNPSSAKMELWTAGNVGHVYQYLDTTLRDYGTTPIQMRLKSGHIYPDSRMGHMWGFRNFNLLIYPKGEHSVSFSYRIDTQKASTGQLLLETTTDDQGALGNFVVLGSFILGQHVLGEESFVQPLVLPLKGGGHAIEWEISNVAIDEDLEVAGWYLEIEPNATIRDRI